MEWQNFEYEEFACSHCGANEMDPQVIDDLQELRTAVGAPFIITSGYRCPQHPLELAKSALGPHTTGKAMDISIRGQSALKLLVAVVLSAIEEAGEMRWSGFGFKQHGEGRIVHLDQCSNALGRPRPTLWTYP